MIQRTPLVILLLLATCFGAGAQLDTEVLITTVTITNPPTDGMTLTVNGSTRVWTNNIAANPGTFIQTNATIAGSQSNLLAHVSGAPFARVYWTEVSTNAIRFQVQDPGAALVITIGGAWATTGTSTNLAGTNEFMVRIPVLADDIEHRTNIWSQVVFGISEYGVTNTIKTNAAAFVHYLDIGPETAILTPGKLIQNGIWTNMTAHITNGTIDGVTLTDVSIDNAAITNATLHGSRVDMVGIIPNVLFRANTTPASASGVMQWARQRGGATPSATQSGDTIGNMFWTGYGTTADKATKRLRVIAAENFTDSDTRSYMTLESVDDGSGTLTEVMRIDDDQITFFKPIGFTNSSAVLLSPVATNAWLRGTNRIEGDIAFAVNEISSLANGNNIVDPGNAAFVRFTGTITGNSALNSFSGGWTDRVLWCQNQTGYQLTITHESGFDGTVANRLRTDGEDVDIPNNGWFKLVYDGGDTRWDLALAYPVLASATNAVAMIDGSATNLDVWASSAITTPLTIHAFSGGISNIFSVLDTNGSPVMYVNTNAGGTLVTSNLTILAGGGGNAGDVWESDGDGNGSWQTPSAGSTTLQTNAVDVGAESRLNLIAGSGITLLATNVSGTNSVSIASVAGTGEANTMSNAGGVGLVNPKAGVDLPIKGLNSDQIATNATTASIKDGASVTNLNQYGITIQTPGDGNPGLQSLNDSVGIAYTFGIGSAGEGEIQFNDGSEVAAVFLSGMDTNFVLPAMGFGTDTPQAASQVHVVGQSYFHGPIIVTNGAATFPGLTASRVAILNGANQLTNSAGVDTTELEHLDGVTGPIQTALDLKLESVPLSTNGVSVGNMTSLDIAATGTNTLFTLTNNAGAISFGVHAAGGAGSPVALLDGSQHSDTVAAAVSRGSLIYGNATPEWDELTIGSAGTFLGSDGTDAVWVALNPNQFSGGSIKSGALVTNLNVRVLNFASGLAELQFDTLPGSIAQRSGTLQQTFRVYNTYTSASNYERARLQWTNDVFWISTEAETGTLRDMRVDAANIFFGTGGTDRWKIDSSGHLIAVSDNQFDLGAAGATRPRDIYVADDINAGGELLLSGSASVASATITNNLALVATSGSAAAASTNWVIDFDKGSQFTTLSDNMHFAHATNFVEGMEEACGFNGFTGGSARTITVASAFVMTNGLPVIVPANKHFRISAVFTGRSDSETNTVITLLQF